MERLWAPWRIEYIMGEKNKECIFCQKSKEHKDEENYILLRRKKCIVMLNIFPYNNGHLMIAPYRHIGSIEQLNKEESEAQMVKLLKRVLHPAGFNIGMNLGKVAGAGIVGHLHIHVVPRWRGDSNFMPVISETKVISEALQKTYQKLKEGL